jgi:hypothetical protein
MTSSVKCFLGILRGFHNCISYTQSKGKITVNDELDKKFWELIAHFLFIRLVQQFVNCCVCIRYGGNVYT